MKFTEMLEERKRKAEGKRQAEQQQQQQQEAQDAAANPLRAYLRMLLKSAVTEMETSAAVPLQIRPMVSALSPVLTAASSRLTEAQARAIAEGIVHFADTQLKPMLAMFPTPAPLPLEEPVNDESRAIH